MKGNVGASRHIRYAKTPKDGADGHTYSIAVSPSSVAVSSVGAVVPASLGNTVPTVTMCCDGAVVTSQPGSFSSYAVQRKGVRLTDGAEETVASTKTKLSELAALYSSVRYDMVSNIGTVSTIPVLASATLTFVRNGKDGTNGTNGHTYAVTVSPSSVRVGVNGVPTVPDHIHMVPTVTLYRDGKDVTSQGTVYAVHRSGVRAKDGVWVESIPDNLTSLGLLGINYDSVRFDMIPANVAAGADIPVLASATLTFAREGAQGTVGAFVPPPMLWEDYPDDYEFLPGAEGDERRDVVLHGSPAAATGLIPSYMCVRKHRKSASREPGADSGWETDWKVSHSMGFLATRVLLADTANIGLTATQAVRVYDNSTPSKIVGEFSGCSEPKPLMSTQGGPSSQTSDNTRYLPLWLGGEMNKNGTFSRNPTFAVDKSGMSFFGGFNVGRRIIIDPNNKGSDGKVSPRITLFDADGNQRVMIDGESHSIGQVYNNGTPTWHNPPSNTFATIGGSQTDTLANVTAGSAGGHLTVSLKLDLNITSAAYSPGGTTQSVTQTVPRIRARILLLKGSSAVDSADLDMIGNKWSDGVGLPTGVNATPATQSKSGTATLKLDTHIGAGEYEVRLVRSIDYYLAGDDKTKGSASADVKVNAGPNPYTHTFTAGSDYKAFIGADSLLIARTATEYFRAGVTEGGALIVEARVNDHGIRVNNGGVYARNRTTGTWEAMYVTCETTAADANACVCDQTGQRVFLTDNQTDNLPAGVASKYGAITTVTLNASTEGGTHIQEFRTLSSPVQCYSRRCLGGTWSAWTKVY